MPLTQFRQAADSVPPAQFRQAHLASSISSINGLGLLRSGFGRLLAAGFEVGFGLLEGMAELTGAVFCAVTDAGDFLLGGF